MKERLICRLAAVRGGRKQSNSESLLCGMCETGRLDEGLLESARQRAPCGSTTKIRVRLRINAYLFCGRTKGKSQLHCVNSHFHSFTRRGVRKTVKFPKFTPHAAADLSADLTLCQLHEHCLRYSISSYVCELLSKSRSMSRTTA